MTDNASRFFVQFPHPGPEHVPVADDMPWNVAAHRRKFLIAAGRYVDAAGQLDAADLVLWGEWEAPSRVECRWPRSGRLPRVLHRPYWAIPLGTSSRQNTDPWVWGERMLYSNCKQVLGLCGEAGGLEPRATSMQRLTRGSVICFGSTIEHEFCIDTVFVVASAEPWVPADARTLDLGEAFVVCTADSLVTLPGGAHLGLTLYRGATVDDPVDGMFSFAPAQKVGSKAPRFPRPAIRVEGLINPANRQSTWGSKRTLGVRQVYDAWCALASQTLDAGLFLGVSFETPARAEDSQPLPSSTRGRC